MDATLKNNMDDNVTNSADDKERKWTTQTLNTCFWIFESDEPEALELREKLIAVLTPEQRKKMEAILQT